MRRAVVMVVGLFTLVASVLVASQRIPLRAAYDQKLYHVPSIKQFAQSLPSFDPWDYLSATTPGYHLLYALVYRAAGESLAALQLLSVLIGAAFYWLLARMVTARVGVGARAHLVAAALCMPLVTSPYTLYPAVYILPDMLGWLCVLAIVAITLRTRIGAGLLTLAGVTLVVLVMTRQIHIWVAGPLVFAAALQRVDFSGERGGWDDGRATSQVLAALRGAAPAVLACLPAVLVLGLFVRYWGGLVPVRFQGWYPTRTVVDMALSPAAAFFLTMMGVYGCFLLPLAIAPLRALWQRSRAWVLGWAGLGAMLALIPPTTYDYDAGRRTGIWNLTAQLPEIAGRTSPLIVLGATWGAVLLAALLSVQPVRQRLVYGCIMAAYCAAMSASQETWQRYFDPMVLIVLALLGAGAAAAYPVQNAWWAGPKARMAGPLVLGVLLAAQSALPFVRSATTTMNAPPPPAKSEDHQGAEPPVLFAPPEKPAGKRFWGFYSRQWWTIQADRGPIVTVPALAGHCGVIHDHDASRAYHGHHGTGRELPRGVSAREGV